MPAKDPAQQAPVQLLAQIPRFPPLFRMPEFTFTTDDAKAHFSVRGQDKLGRPWVLNLRPALHGIWRSDEGDARTYYFAGYTGAAGMGPAMWLLALSFDDQGLPVPFYLVTYGQYDAGGIANLLNLDGGNPELLEQQYWGNIMDDPGYFVTTLYRKQGAYWHRADGLYGSHDFPTYELWSVTWRDRPAELVTGAPPTKQPLRNSGNDPATGLRTTVQRAQWNGIEPNGLDCSFVGVDVVVIDTPGGRSIEMDDVENRLKQLADSRANVVLTGLYRWPNTSKSCDASILWATVDR